MIVSAGAGAADLGDLEQAASNGTGLLAARECVRALGRTVASAHRARRRLAR